MRKREQITALTQKNVSSKTSKQTQKESDFVQRIPNNGKLIFIEHLETCRFQICSQPIEKDVSKY